MTLTPGRLEAFPQQFPFVNGLDLGRSVIGRALGVYEADPNAVIRAGMLVARNSSGLIIPAVGADPIGVAKWNKSLFLKAPIVDEPVTLNAEVVTPLKHALVENVKVTDAAGTPYTLTTDYLLNATNGTVARVALGSIADGETVLVTYTFQIAEADLDFQGRNFFNFIDDVTVAQGRITVIQDWSLLFTTQYDTSRVYAVNDKLDCGGGVTAALTGLFTNDAAEGDFVGKVAQIPTATDAYLGVEIVGSPTP